MPQDMPERSRGPGFRWRPHWIYRDREDAGRQLAAHLTGYREEQPIVLALPRGGVPVGFEVARALDAPLDVFPVRKLGAPGHRELGVGAIAPGGVYVLNRSAIVALGITREQLEQVVKEETTELDRRLQRYRGDRPLPDLRDRTVIVVDDGLATGVSAMVAIRAIREHQPRRIVLAVPVCAPETADELRGEVDEIVCAARPQNFLGVGLWYERFDPTTDEEVLELLERARETVSPSR